jgi:F0F1-type ATP synthase delta subunit
MILDFDSFLYQLQKRQKEAEIKRKEKLKDAQQRSLTYALKQIKEPASSGKVNG